MVDKLGAAYEQGLATAACLLSGFHIFQPAYPEQDRLLRVLRGLHGLHVYASEYWVEYLLSVAASNNGLDADTRFFSRSLELGKILSSLHSTGDQKLDEKLSDSRLPHLKNHFELWKAAGLITSAQAAKHSETGKRPRSGRYDPHNPCTCRPTKCHKKRHTDSARSQTCLHFCSTTSTQSWRFSNCGASQVSAFRNSKDSSKTSALQPSLVGSNHAPSLALGSRARLFGTIMNEPTLRASPVR